MKRLMVIMMILSVLSTYIIDIPVHGATEITISKVLTTPTTVSANGEFTLNFNITNRTSGDISDVYMEVISDEYQIVGSGAKVSIYSETIGAGVDKAVAPIPMKRVGSSATTISVKLTYTGGTTGIHSDTISINASVSSGTPSTPVATETYKPTFSLVNSTFPLAFQGNETTAKIGLKNTSSYQGKNLTITPDLTGLQAAGIRVNSTNFSPTDTTIDSSKSGDFQMMFIVDDKVEEGNYPMTLELEYTNAYNDRFTQKITTYLRVVKDTNKAHQVLLEMTPNNNGKLTAGETLTLAFKMSNKEMKISSPHIEIKNLPESLTLIKGSEVVDYNYLIGAGVTTFDVAYTIDKKTPSGWHSFDVSYSYVTYSGNKLNRIKTFKYYVNGLPTTNADVSIEGVKYPESILENKTFNVDFAVKNIGTQDIKNVKVALVENAIFIPKSNSLIQLKTIARGKDGQVSFQLVASSEGLVDRNYPITFKITYDYEKNGVFESSSLEQILGVYVDAKEKPVEGETTTKGVPKIIIDQYVANPMIVDAGTEFDLSLSFLNTHSIQSIYNIKAFLTSVETSATTQNNIFMPVNSSNTFYIDSIGPKGIVEKSIRLYAMPDAQPKTYTIQVNFEYEDKDGKAITATELVGVSVKQPTKVEMSEVNIPTEVMMGEMIPIYFDVYNTGKVKVYNLIVKAEGNFTMDPMSKYIGNFEPGFQDYFDGYLSPMEPGPLTGRLILAYDDPTGEHIEEVKEFSINVMEGMIDPGFPVDGEFPDGYPGEFPVDEGGMSGFNWYLIGIPIAVVIVLVIGLVVGLKKRKAKKEGLMIDED